MVFPVYIVNVLEHPHLHSAYPVILSLSQRPDLITIISMWVLLQYCTTTLWVWWDFSFRKALLSTLSIYSMPSLSCLQFLFRILPLGLFWFSGIIKLLPAADLLSHLCHTPSSLSFENLRLVTFRPVYSKHPFKKVLQSLFHPLPTFIMEDKVLGDGIQDHDEKVRAECRSLM